MLGLRMIIVPVYLHVSIFSNLEASRKFDQLGNLCHGIYNSKLILKILLNCPGH